MIRGITTALAVVAIAAMLSGCATAYMRTDLSGSKPKGLYPATRADVAGFMLAGVPQSSLSFLNDCRQTGQFRATPYRMPTREQASGALREICKTNNWQVSQFFENQVDRFPEAQ